MMLRKTFSAAALGVAFLLPAVSAHAALGVVDPVGDFLPSFGGTATPDLDVVSTFGTYNASTNMFHISGTFAGAVNPANTGALYVFGFDRGAGTERFAANGVPGVIFDSVVSLNPSNLAASSITLMGATNTTTLLSPSAITISGNTISADFSASLLPSTGLAANKYTYNLWPRDTRAAGFAAISDFAPDGSNITLAPVPEPETYAMLVAGLGVIGFLRRRRNAG
jgi:hypothetical protein